MTVLMYPYEHPEEGGLSGYLSAVFEAYRLKLRQPRFRCLRAPEQEPELFNSGLTVPLSEERAERVARGVMRRGGDEVWKTVLRAFLSDAGGREDMLYLFIRRLMDGGEAELLHRLDLPEVAAVVRAAGRTAREAQKFLGILRFVKYADIYYAPMEPECRILPLTAAHFRARFADQAWIIHDLRRKEALFWNKRDLTFETGVTARAPEDEDAFFQGLWKSYFTAAALAERRNLNLQRNFVPLKYRSHMPEMQ
ncbi:MAG: TIGR03915 family putative DNA repair protein [Spirochaetales bacterium]|nr:TIGR03915 family putative DNA repair protein [Spirochaetales bacterium]